MKKRVPVFSHHLVHLLMELLAPANFRKTMGTTHSNSLGTLGWLSVPFQRLSELWASKSHFESPWVLTMYMYILKLLIHNG